MKKELLSSFIVLFCYCNAIHGQSFDWNLRGGTNLMHSERTGRVSFLYHAGIQAGIRIADYGIYGEGLYSLHEDKYGGNPIPYFIPGLVLKGFWRKLIFVQVGGSLLSEIGKSAVNNDTMNPTSKLFLTAGLGVHFSIIELSLRSYISHSYQLVQATLGIKL